MPSEQTKKHFEDLKARLLPPSQWFSRGTGLTPAAFAWVLEAQSAIEDAFGAEHPIARAVHSASEHLRTHLFYGAEWRAYARNRDTMEASFLAAFGLVMSDRPTQVELRNASPRTSPPNHFSHLADSLDRFWADTPFEKSVFVMMKFPAHTMPREEQDCLNTIYDTISQELLRHNLVARRADKKTFSPNKNLWDNLCIYMLGCRYGVAVLQDKVGDELNPNVTLEFGFMSALGRDVVLLQERDFAHVRADILSTIPKTFSIEKDLSPNRDSVRDAIASWLIDAGVTATTAK